MQAPSPRQGYDPWRGSLPIFQVRYSWPVISVDIEPRPRKSRLYFSNLCQELKHLKILISKGGSGKIPRDDCISIPPNLYFPRFPEISQLLCTLFLSSFFCDLYLANLFVHYCFSATLHKNKWFKKINRKGSKTEGGEEHGFVLLKFVTFCFIVPKYYIFINL